MVTSATTCICRVRKFCRRLVNETSAQVGRVAWRTDFPVTVVATTPRLYPSQRLCGGYARATGTVSVPGEHKIHHDLGFHLDWLAVQNVGPIPPLPHRRNCRCDQHRVSG